MRSRLARSRAVVLLATLGAVAACSDAASPVAPQPAVAFAKAGPPPNGPNALPERGRIVFPKFSALGAHTNLYSINEDGSGLKRLTYSTTGEGWPAASRDGKKIAYVTGGVFNAATSDLAVMNADGSLPRVITSLGLQFSRVSRMDWSPSGKQIAIALNQSDDPDDWNIHLINVSSGAMTQLTSFPGAEAFPSWSPDGGRLAFHMNDGNGVKQIFTMNSDGTDITQFTYCFVDCTEPAWSPDSITITSYDPSTETTTVRWTNGSSIAGSFLGRYAAWAPDASRLVYMNWDAGVFGFLSTASYTGADERTVVPELSAAHRATWLRK